jgi:hypothetical protein
MRHFVNICFILFCLSASISAGEIEILKYAENEKLISFSETAKYITTHLKNKSNNTYKLVVTNKNGVSVLEKKGIEPFVRFSKSIDELDALIYVVPRYANSSFEEFVADRVESVNLSTGALNWSVSSLASSYELSGDYQYLLTNSPPMMQSANFEIIDIVSGEKRISKKFPFVYYATWFDNNHVLLAIKEISETPNPEYANYQKLHSKKGDLIREKQILTIKYEKGLISKKDFISKERELLSKIDGIRNKIKKKYHYSRRKSAPRKVDTVPQTARFRIYNIETDSFVSNKQVYDQKGDKLYFDPFFATGICVDKEKNIYFKATKEEKNFNDHLIKLNANLDLEKDFHILHPHRFTRFVHNDKIFFAIKMGDSYYLLDRFFNKIDKTQVKVSQLIPPNADLVKIFTKSVNMFSDNISVDEEKKKILFQRKEGE